jgi:hypothetical protein
MDALEGLREGRRAGGRIDAPEAECVLVPVPSPVESVRSQMPIRPNSCAVSSSSRWRSACAVSRWFRVTSTRTQMMFAPTILRRASTHSGVPSRLLSSSSSMSACGAASSLARARRELVPAGPDGAKLQQRDGQAPRDEAGRVGEAAVGPGDRADGIREHEQVATLLQERLQQGRRQGRLAEVRHRVRHASAT